MKQKIIALLATLTLTCGLVAGCGSAEEAATPVEQTESAESAETQETAQETETTEIANPWVDITEDEAKTLCDRLFKAPEGATDVVWSKCEDLGDPSTGLGPLVQLSFTLDDLYYTARAQQGADEDADIAGNYVEWTVGPMDTTLANWGGGNMTGKTYRSINDTGYVDMITWYDMEIGISYSLSVAAADLDGFDIQAIAEQMYAEDNEPFGNMPDDFLQEQSGKTSFESFDDIIAELTSGQGYAYLKVYGSDEEVLAVTDLVFEADHSAYEISVYGKWDGMIKHMGTARGNGSSYPLRLEDGIIYGGDNHTYETYFASTEFGSIMMKDMVSDGVNDGTNKLYGFTRQDNTVESTEWTGTQEDFDKLIQDREKKPVIEFTMVE